jgi:hypothetical protein
MILSIEEMTRHQIISSSVDDLLFFIVSVTKCSQAYALSLEQIPSAMPFGHATRWHGLPAEGDRILQENLTLSK